MYHELTLLWRFLLLESEPSLPAPIMLMSRAAVSDNELPQTLHRVGFAATILTSPHFSRSGLTHSVARNTTAPLTRTVSAESVKMHNGRANPIEKLSSVFGANPSIPSSLEVPISAVVGPEVATSITTSTRTIISPNHCAECAHEVARQHLSSYRDEREKTSRLRGLYHMIVPDKLLYSEQSMQPKIMNMNL